MIQKLPSSTNKIYGYKYSGKFTHEDYQAMLDELETAIEREGKISLLGLIEDFHGWDLRSAWDDIVFDFKHYNDIERIALVSDEKYADWMAKFARPFNKAEVKSFKANELEEAWAWLKT